MIWFVIMVSNFSFSYSLFVGCLFLRALFVNLFQKGGETRLDPFVYTSMLYFNTYTRDWFGCFVTICVGMILDACDWDFCSIGLVFP